MYDLLIKNGKIVDGSGKQAFKADIGIKHDKIQAISPKLKGDSKVTIDASGYIVCPGFIDIHSHSDFTLLINPKGESKIRQGITTEVVGNCGFTPAPVRKDHFDAFMQFLVNTVHLNNREKSRWNWKTQGDFVSQIEKNGSSFNIASLVGHGTVRIAVMGFEKRKPTPSELHQMLKILEEEMQQGLFGMSTGLAYEPGVFATTEELTEMCKVVADYGGIYATHMKSEGKYLLECISEVIEIAESTGVSAEISHLKAVNPKNWLKIADALNMIDQANQRGLCIDFDVYPYTAYGSGLIDLIPPWFKEDGLKEMIKKLKQRNYKENIVYNMAYNFSSWENPMEDCSWNNVRVASVKSRKNKKYEGKNINQIAQHMGCSPYDAVIRLLIEEDGAVKMVFFGMREEDIHTLMKYPRAIFATDGRAVAPYGKLSKGKIHPRYYGTYPRILGHYVREKKLISLEEAIHKMTFLPAKKINLKDRGLLKEGYYADITIFDKDKVIDLATFDEPHRYPEGIEYVIVNGSIVISKGEHTGKLPGKVLLNKNKTQ